VQCEKVSETNADFHILPLWGWCDRNKTQKPKAKRHSWTIKAEGDLIMAHFKFTSMTDREFDRIKKRLLLSFRL